MPPKTKPVQTPQALKRKDTLSANGKKVGRKRKYGGDEARKRRQE